MRILVVLFIILNCLYGVKLHAVTTIVYYCETADGKHGYSDRPCAAQMFKQATTKQIELSLINFKLNNQRTYRINSNNLKINPKQQLYNKQLLYCKKQLYCNKIEEKIIFCEKKLKNIRKKLTMTKLKRRINKYKSLKRKNCD